MRPSKPVPALTFAALAESLRGGLALICVACGTRYRLIEGTTASTCGTCTPARKKRRTRPARARRGNGQSSSAAAIVRASRLRDASGGGGVPAKVIAQRSAGTCVYCSYPAEHADHIRALSRGGWHDAANLVPACSDCNSAKNNMLLVEWDHRRVVHAMLRSQLVADELLREITGSPDGCGRVRRMAPIGTALTEPRQMLPTVVPDEPPRACRIPIGGRRAVQLSQARPAPAPIPPALEPEELARMSLEEQVSAVVRAQLGPDYTPRRRRRRRRRRRKV